MKRILFLNHNIMNRGTFFRCYYLGKELSFLGYDITLVTVTDESFSLKSRLLPVNNNFRIIKLPKSGFHRRYSGHLRRALISTFILLTGKYDLVHSFAVANPSTAIPCIICRFLRPGVPIVIDWDDAWSEGFAPYFDPVTAGVIRFFENNTPKLCRAKKITVVSEYLKKYAEKIGYNSNLLEIIPNGSTISELEIIPKEKARNILGLPIDKKIIVAVGRTYKESLNHLFLAFENVLVKFPSAILVMVGAIRINSDKAFIKANDIYKKYRANILLAGEQNYKKTINYIMAADVLALPMDNSPIDKARFPIRLSDYLASGKPVVSNAVGETERILKNEPCAVLCRPNDIGDFSNAFVNLFEINCKPSSTRSNFNNTYSWNKITKKLDTIYFQLIIPQEKELSCACSK